MPPRKGFMTATTAMHNVLDVEQDIDLAVAPQLASQPSHTQNIPVDRIRPNPYQARQNFVGVEELAAAIQAQGFITRLRVRPDPSAEGYFQLVFGERRLRAARLAGLPSVPCDVAQHTDADLIEIGLSENLQRRDLDPLEEARALQGFIEHHGYTIRKLAERLGKDKTFIELRLALLKAPDDIQQMVAQKPEALTAARDIAKLETAEQRAPIIKAVVAGQLSTADVRSLVKEQRAPSVVDETVPFPSDLGISSLMSIQEEVVEQRGVRQPMAEQRQQASLGIPNERLTDRALDRDFVSLRTMMARWRQSLPLTSKQGERVLALISELVADLEVVAEDIRRQR